MPFEFKRDVIPDHPNHFEVTPTKTGTFIGRCTELCGVYHSRMLFRVKIVTPAAVPPVDHGAAGAADRSQGVLSDHHRAAGPAAIAAPRALPQGLDPGRLAVVHRPQDHRPPVPDHLVLLLPDRRR